MIEPSSIAAQVVRLDTTQPGFAVVEAGEVSSSQLRGLLVQIGRELIDWYHVQFGPRLSFRSLNWFSQLVPTRPHRDGGPDASLLLLGYEPTPVRSRLFLLDHSKAAASVGLSPREFLVRHNPAFGKGAELLQPFTTEATTFDPSRPQVVLVNNSAQGADELPGMLGVLHHAHVETAPAGAVRPISSVLIGLGEGGLGEAELAAFVRDGTGAAV